MKVKLTNHDDSFDGIAQSDFINGLDGNDYLTGNAGNDTLLGGNGDDVLSGGIDKDMLLGDDGDDQLDGGVGADKMNGGDGDDYYWVDDLGDKVIEKPYDGYDTVESRVHFTLPEHVESLTLTGNKAINGMGNNLDNSLIGNAANNTLSGLFGNDHCSGQEGNDSLDGGKGNDRLYGDSGDWYDYNPANGGNDTLDGGTGNDRLYGGEASDLLIGDLGNDNLFGDFEHWNEIDYDGNPRIGASDTLYGGEGSDYLYGGFGNDALYGDNGDDDLMGGGGIDTLDGGEGDDWFYYDPEDQFIGGADIDTIWAVGGQTIDWVTHTNSYGIEAFDLHDFNLAIGYEEDIATLIRLSGSSVMSLNATHDITITASDLDTVELVGNWGKQDSSSTYGYDDYMLDDGLGDTAWVHVSTEAMVTIVGVG